MPLSEHDLPNNRPIHPECPLLDNPLDKCRCGPLWDEWDGSDETLAQRIEAAESLDRRSKFPVARPLPGGVGGDYSPHDDVLLDELCGDAPEPTTDDLSGFWKQSEVLKAIKDERNQ